MSSSSDSDCQLYTRTAEHIAIKQKEIEEDRKDLALHMKYLPDDQVQGYSEVYDKLYDFDVPALSSVSKPSETEVLSITDSEDDIPLMQLKARIRPKRYARDKTAYKSHIEQRGKRVPKKKRNEKSQPSNCRASNNSECASSCGTAPNDTNEIPTIVFDDDTGYPSSASFAPIEFNKRPNSNKKLTEDINFDELQAPIDESSDDEEDLETPCKIAVDWRNDPELSGLNLKHFQLRRYQKFETVFEELAKMEGIPMNRVVIMRNFETIRPRDTPASLNLTYYGQLYGQISDTDVDHSLPKLSDFDDYKKPPEGEIKVKLLLDSKTSLSIKLSKNQKMNVLYKKCSEELNVPDEKIKISFDGEVVQKEDKVSDLGVEDGDAFDVIIKKG